MADQLTQLAYDEDVEFIFTDQFGMNEMKCIEIEPEMVEDLQNGKLEIRGDGDDETILVSATKSYKIRQHDSSNTILLTSYDHNDHDQKNNEQPGPLPMGCHEEIYGAISCIFVLSEQPPRLNNLYQVLYQRPYKGAPTREPSPEDGDGGAERESPSPVDLSLEGLKLVVQCSDRELVEGLEAINALQIEGQWRIVDEEYFFLCFEDLLHRLMEHTVDRHHFRIADLGQNPDDFPAEITAHCVKIHSVSGQMDEDGFWALDDRKLCVFCAKLILSKQPALKMEAAAFESAWREQLPYGVEPDTAMLSGHAITISEGKRGRKMWALFEETKLPLDPKQRFKRLFGLRAEWTMQQITPYLAALVRSGLKSDKLLLRHSRMIRTKGADGAERRLYVSRSARR